MAPKKPDPKAEPPPEAPGPGEVRYPEWTDELLAAESFALDAPFEDPDGLAVLPQGFGTEVTWQRPSEFLGEGAEPCIVQQAEIGEEEAEGEPAPPTRELPNKLAKSGSLAETIQPTVHWLASCFQFVALQAAQMEEGTFLWECIYPKGEGGVPAYSACGKYAVRLWEQGRWRMILVDDRMPFDGAGMPLMPTSSSATELWPMVLAKALYKLAAPYPAGISQDPAVLLHLTGWLPEVVPITDLMPAEASFETIAASLPEERQAAVGVMLPAGADDALSEVGLAHGPLVAVRDARALGDGSRYCCLQSEIVEWTGPLRDTDEASWSFELADLLSWKRLQRLRLRAAGVPLYDYWLSLDSLNSYFSATTTLHCPRRFACSVTHTTVAARWSAELSEPVSDGSSPPTLLHVAGDPAEPPVELVLGFAVTPLDAIVPPVEEGAPPPPPPPPFGSCVVSVATYDWSASAGAPALLRVPVTSASTFTISVSRGATYCISAVSLLPEGYTPPTPPVDEGEEGAAEEAEGEATAEPGAEGAPPEAAPPPPPEVLPIACHLTVSACSDAELALADLPTISKEQLGLQLASVDGTIGELPMAEWGVGFAVSLKPTEACTVNLAATLAEAHAAACCRLHLVGEDVQSEQSFADLQTGGFALDPELNPSGYTLLGDLKPTAMALAASGWSVAITATSEVAAAAVDRTPQLLSGTYEPNEDYVMCRLVLGCASKASAAVHVSTTLPTALIHARTLQITSASGEEPASEATIKTASGLGCATILAVGIEPPPPAAAKGAEPPPGVTTILEVTVDRLSAIELGLLQRPPRLAAEAAEAEGEEGDDSNRIGWSVAASSASAVTLAKDTAREEELAALVASWESAAPGRAVKARDARAKYLAELAAAREAAEAKAAESHEGEGEEAAAEGELMLSEGVAEMRAKLAQITAGMDEQIDNVFLALDVDHNSFLSAEEMKATFSRYMKLDESLFVSAFFAAFDTHGNPNGQIDLHEFRWLMAQEALGLAYGSAEVTDEVQAARLKVPSVIAEFEELVALIDPPRALRRPVPADGAARVVAAAEVEQWREEKAARIASLGQEREAKENQRAGLKEGMAETTAEAGEKVKARRTKVAARCEAFATERQELLGKLLPEPPEPPEPAAKGKKK